MMVPADRGGDNRFFPQEGQGISNVAGRPAELLLQAVYLETDVQNMDFIRENVFLEVSREIHNPVVSEDPETMIFILLL